MLHQQFIEEMKKIQIDLLNFLDSESNYEEKYQNLITLFNDIKIQENKHKLKSFLHLLVQISNNHIHTLNFYSKIEKILLFFQDCIKKKFSKQETFNIFSMNKRLLLFLLEENMIECKYLVKQIMADSSHYFIQKYFEYFLPEIKPFKNEKWFPSKYYYLEKLNKEIPEDFYEKRKTGEDDFILFELIRKDSIKDFIVYINKNNYPLDRLIHSSIYETNHYLITRVCSTLIRYSAFFGSIQTFNYLKLNDEKNVFFNLWEYAIHGQNAEIIHIVEENGIKLNKNDYIKLFENSIQFHSNDVANYLKINYLNNEKVDELNIDYIFKYYNFAFMQDDLISESLFVDLCKYDYYYFVEFLLKNHDIDVNKKIKIQQKKFFFKISFLIFFNKI